MSLLSLEHSLNKPNSQSDLRHEYLHMCVLNPQIIYKLLKCATDQYVHVSIAYLSEELICR